jgi:four helix bundle protein
MTQERENSIASFRDLDVYQKAYEACIEVIAKIVPDLPDSGKLDLKKQLSSSAEAIPRLVGEGYAKRHQFHGANFLKREKGRKSKALPSGQ